MTQVILPRLNQTGANEWADVEANDVALREVLNGGVENDNIKANAGIVRSKLAADAKPVTWYTPKIIAAEESRTNTAFGTLGTADEIKEVVLPTNGLIFVGFQGLWKSSVSGAGRAAIFIGGNQLKRRAEIGSVPVQEASSISSGECSLVTDAVGLVGAQSGPGPAEDVTTGQLVAWAAGGGAACVFAAAGTYNVSIQFKATSGSVTAWVRKLWVWTLGS